METTFSILIALTLIAALLLAAFVGFRLLAYKDEEMRMKRRKEAREALDRLKELTKGHFTHI